jgi:hypothetical protein
MQPGAVHRFGEAVAARPDRRDQRRRDQAAGLVPFAVKLDAGLVRRIRSLAEARGLSHNDMVAQLLAEGLKHIAPEA